jgi:hypothetical protein
MCILTANVEFNDSTGLAPQQLPNVISQDSGVASGARSERCILRNDPHHLLQSIVLSNRDSGTAWKYLHVNDLSLLWANA